MLIRLTSDVEDLPVSFSHAVAPKCVGVDDVVDDSALADKEREREKYIAFL